jgi:hypothetical protein
MMEIRLNSQEASMLTAFGRLPPEEFRAASVRRLEETESENKG